MIIIPLNRSEVALYSQLANVIGIVDLALESSDNGDRGQDQDS